MLILSIIRIIDKINIPIGTLNPLLKIYATTNCNPDFCDTDFGTLLDTEFNVSDKLGIFRDLDGCYCYFSCNNLYYRS